MTLTGFGVRLTLQPVGFAWCQLTLGGQPGLFGSQAAGARGTERNINVLELNVHQAPTGANPLELQIAIATNDVVEIASQGRLTLDRGQTHRLLANNNLGAIARNNNAALNAPANHHSPRAASHTAIAGHSTRALLRQSDLLLCFQQRELLAQGLNLFTEVLGHGSLAPPLRGAGDHAARHIPVNRDAPDPCRHTAARGHDARAAVNDWPAILPLRTVQERYQLHGKGAVRVQELTQLLAERRLVVAVLGRCQQIFGGFLCRGLATPPGLHGAPELADRVWEFLADFLDGFFAGFGEIWR